MISLAKDPAVGLTDKQQRFCEHFVSSFNATAAYLHAYDCTPKAAESGGARLLRNAKVQSYLQILREKTQERSIASLERTMDEIARVAYADITNVLSFNSMGVIFRNSDELPQSVTAAIESVTVHETESEHGITRKQSLKMHNKMTALGYLADFFGIRDDFNKARATLKRYGLAVVRDEDSELGWKIEKYAPSSDPDAA